MLYSVVVPVFNEEKTINIFYKVIIPIMESLNESFEIIFVDDGSKDKSIDILKNLANTDSRVKVLSFSRNFGQLPAVFCGLEYSKGDAVIPIDVDLQDPVEIIPKMIDKWKEGYEIVHGKRKIREKETLFKKITSKIFLTILRKSSKLNIPTNVGDFKLLDRKVVNVLIKLKEHDKYLRGLVAWTGFKETEVSFVRKERVNGKTKYNFKKMFQLATNALVTLTYAPLNFVLCLSVLLLSASSLCFIVFIVLICFNISLPLIAWLFPTLGFFTSCILLSNVFTNKYIKQIYEETKNRPNYIVREKFNID